MRQIDLSGKHAYVAGVANQRSLAWAIADALGQAGARLALSYQGERVKDAVAALAKKYPHTLVMPCDVSSEQEMDGVFWRIGENFGKLDVFVHSIAFARKVDLEGTFIKTTRDGWRTALDISAYSLLALTNRSLPLMKKSGGGSIMALTFQASQRVFPNYNVMGTAKAALEHTVRQLAYELGSTGIRVNAISAGPVTTASARGISGFTGMLQHYRKASPLGRSIEPREVGDAALFLASELSTGITGTTLYVDAGYHIMGV